MVGLARMMAHVSSALDIALSFAFESASLDGVDRDVACLYRTMSMRALEDAIVLYGKAESMMIDAIDGGARPSESMSCKWDCFKLEFAAKVGETKAVLDGGFGAFDA